MLELVFRKFSLPLLTLQPLVENTIRYGITKKIAATPSQSEATSKTDKCIFSFWMTVLGLIKTLRKRPAAAISELKILETAYHCNAAVLLQSEVKKMKERWYGLFCQKKEVTL